MFWQFIIKKLLTAQIIFILIVSLKALYNLYKSIIQEISRKNREKVLRDWEKVRIFAA